MNSPVRTIPQQTSDWASELLSALDGARLLAPPSLRTDNFSIEDGYAVAAEHVRLRTLRGEQPIGRKLGFTNRNIWAEYGVAAPIWAHMYAHSVRYAPRNSLEVSLARTVAPRLEPEIAFKLSRALPADSRDPRQILQSVEWMARSFEIVDCHYPDWKFTGADVTADFGFHAMLIVGEPRALSGRDLDALAAQLGECKIDLTRDGDVVDTGIGANALGHPCLALAFVAELLQRQPQFAPLAPGEIITTGTLTAAFPIQPGATWRSAASGIDLPALSITLVD